MPPDRAKSTIRPSRAGSLPAEPVALCRGKKKPCYTQSTTREGQAWKAVTEADGKPRPFTCPKCHSIIRYDGRGFIGCGDCSWAPNRMTQKVRKELEAKDPEMIPVLQFLQKAESWTPAFEGHANHKKISGKERREKRFLSKCAGRGECD